MKISASLTTLFFLVILLFFPARSFAAGAVLFFSPSSGSYAPGQDFTVNVYVSSPDQAINAVSSSISFPGDILSVSSVSSAGSIVNFWAQEPAHDNGAGSVSFEGVILSPGYTGARGKLISINFKAKKAADAVVRFLSGSVLANDGKGTNIIGSFENARFGIGSPNNVSPAPDPVAAPLSQDKTPSAPAIDSSTNPDQEKWYRDNDLKFSWSIPKDATGVKTLLDKNLYSAPVKYSGNLISEKEFQDVDDGVWYFHVELCNRSGCGKISHYKVQIDATKPEAFSVKTIGAEKTTDPQPLISFLAEDKTSGIDYYEIKAGDGIWLQTKDPEYKLPPQEWGRRTVLVKAVDKAGNETLSAVEIEIIPIEAPQITNFPNEISSGSYIYVSGTSLSDATVMVYIRREDTIEEGETKSDSNGLWSYAYGTPAQAGVYQIWSQVVDSNGAKSDLSGRVTVVANLPAFIRIGKLIIEYLSISIALLILVLILIFIIIWGWRSIRRRMSRAMKTTSKAERSLYQAFDRLEKEVEKEIAKIDGDPKMSKKEKEVSERLKAALKNSEQYIQKEIKNIEKKLR